MWLQPLQLLNSTLKTVRSDGLNYELFLSPARVLEMTSAWEEEWLEGSLPSLATATPWTPPFPKKYSTPSQVAQMCRVPTSVRSRKVWIGTLVLTPLPPPLPTLPSPSPPPHQPSRPWQLLRVTRPTLEVLWSAWTQTLATVTGTARRWMDVRRWDVEREERGRSRGVFWPRVIWWKEQQGFTALFSELIKYYVFYRFQKEKCAEKESCVINGVAISASFCLFLII